MKKVLSCVYLVCSSLLFIMCNSEDETSIINEHNSLQQEEISIQDNSLENWVKKNSKVLNTYKREEIGAYPRDVQKAILRSFSPEKRKSLWQSKVDYLLSSHDFSKEEKEYFKWFAEKFKKVSYDEAMSKELSQELYDKALAGMDKFGWSKSQIYKMFFTISNVNDNEREQIKKGLIKASFASSGVSCECYYDLGCPTWDCDSSADCGDEETFKHDCGVFGDTECDGNC